VGGDGCKGGGEKQHVFLAAPSGLIRKPVLRPAQCGASLLFALCVINGQLQRLNNGDRMFLRVLFTLYRQLSLIQRELNSVGRRRYDLKPQCTEREMNQCCGAGMVIMLEMDQSNQSVLLSPCVGRECESRGRLSCFHSSTFPKWDKSSIERLTSNRRPLSIARSVCARDR